MSLTRIITEPEVRAQLKKLIRRPGGFDGRRKLLASPITKHYNLVGTAFDYLFRFYLKRVNPQAVERGHWVAESAASCTDAMVLHADSDRIEIMPELVTDPDKHKLAVKMQRVIAEAKENYRVYLKTGRVTEKLLRSAVELAKLDIIYRTGRPDLVDLAADIDKRDLDDLQKLMKVIPAGEFKTKEVCVLNPTFGEASQLVRGADGDVISNNTLIEIKTVMKCQLLSKYLHELVGYYCLYRIAVPGVLAEKPLRRLGVYFSRFGYFFSVPITECWRARDFKAFLKWFEHFIRARA